MYRTRHLFPGSNTANGFVGFFGDLKKDIRRTVILKGGPGVGKSTLMGKAGRHYEKKGMEVIYFHCSGDPDSLDAVRVPEAGFLMVDGTAPHIMDPALPGAADGILNLGECLDEKQLECQAEEIRELTQDISRCFAQAYRYLSSALSIRKDAEAVYALALPEKEKQLLSHQLAALLPAGEAGGEAHAFAQAITWKGEAQYVDALLTDTVYCLDVPWGFDADALLRPVWEEAKNRGLQRSAYHDPLDPERLRHITVGNAAFTTAVLMDAPVFAPELDARVISRENSRLSFDRAAYELMRDQAVEALFQAKEKHDRLERYYIDAMDYDRLEEMGERCLKKLP